MPSPLSLLARIASIPRTPSISGAASRTASIASVALLALAGLIAIPATVSANELTKLKIVVSNTHGRRVQRANVIVTFGGGRTVKSLGRKIITQWEMHATQEGVADIPELPKGKITVRVTAPGYQTFGQVFDVSEDERTIEVTLNPPQEQYSSHEQ